MKTFKNVVEKAINDIFGDDQVAAEKTLKATRGSLTPSEWEAVLNCREMTMGTQLIKAYIYVPYTVLPIDTDRQAKDRELIIDQLANYMLTNAKLAA